MTTLDLPQVRPPAPDPPAGLNAFAAGPAVCLGPDIGRPWNNTLHLNNIMIFWCALVGAIACDVAATYALTASNGFRHLVPSALAVGGFLVTTYLFGVAITGLGPSISYAAFGALGTAAVAGIGVLTGESANWAKVGALTLIIAGVTLLPVTERL